MERSSVDPLQLQDNHRLKSESYLLRPRITGQQMLFGSSGASLHKLADSSILA